MKTKLTIAALFAVTVAAVVAVGMPIKSEQVVAHQQTESLPQQTTQGFSPAPKVELVFVLDTTGSMSGLIEAAKEKIWSIASTMASAKPAPDIHIGIVAYRDRGDDYVTRNIALSSNLDAIYAQLIDLAADGGGDSPESVNAALYQAVNHQNWSDDKSGYKAIFLVGDAPGHQDYPDDIPFAVSVADARAKGIIVNTIQVGHNARTHREWQKIAQLGAGDKFRVEQNGGALAMNTPFDQAIADTSRELDNTRVYFGDKKQQQINLRDRRINQKLHREATPAALARRAKFNLSQSNRSKSRPEQELISALENKTATLGSISKDHLPAEMRAMTVEEQKAFVLKKAEMRKNAEAQLKKLTAERDAYVKNEVAKRAKLKTSLDEQLAETLIVQGSRKANLDYSESEKSY